MNYKEWRERIDQSKGNKIYCQLARLSDDYDFLNLDKNDLSIALKNFQTKNAEKIDFSSDDKENNIARSSEDMENNTAIININRLLKHFCSDAYSSLQHMKTIEEQEHISKELKLQQELQISKSDFENNKSVKFLKDLRRFYDHNSICFASYKFVIPPLQNRKYTASIVLDKNQLLAWKPIGFKAWTKESLDIINHFNFRLDTQIDVHIKNYLKFYKKYYAAFIKAIFEIFKKDIADFSQLYDNLPYPLSEQASDANSSQVGA
jgi:hypothetical protein